ncbi:MAG: hypothetical protein PHI27_13565 [Eubacteriales bacterium]|nr:hypothetical protein [Eubacteriales bacterium]
MSKKRAWLHTASISLLTAPNIIYLSCNFNILREANAIALTMTAMLVLSIVGLGALAHFKANSGIWVTLIGVFILSLSNIAWVAGIALIIEGGGLAIDGYVLKPLITKTKIKELEDNGKQVTYTREIK